MFEKEAKEYLKKDGTKAEQILDMLNEISPLEITLKQVPFILAMIQQVFKDGAEFGYNKSKEELNQNGLALQSDMDKTIEQNIALKKELNKANEWHFVKDGDLPEVDNRIVLCVCFDGYIDEKKHYILKLLTRKEFPLFQPVYAWKEIVLPEQEG